MTKITFKPGDRVWFITKFGDRATGTVDREYTLQGGPSGYLVKSYDAFGRSQKTPTSCFVTGGKLQRGTPAEAPCGHSEVIWTPNGHGAYCVHCGETVA